MSGDGFNRDAVAVALCSVLVVLLFVGNVVAVAPGQEGTRDKHEDEVHHPAKADFKIVDGVTTLSSLTPAWGNRPLLVLLVDFTDTEPYTSNTSEYYDTVVFGSRPSVANYFTEVSYGSFTYTKAGLFGWYSYPHTLEESAGSGENYADMTEWALRQAAGDGFDFAQYDTDDNDELTNEELTILVVLAGTSVGVHWSPAPKTIDGIEIELERSLVGEITNWGDLLGPIAHELGHDLGLPDLYDYTRNEDSPSAGIGDYGLMGGGDSCGPTHMTAWEKSQVGWLSPIVVGSSGFYTLRDSETHAQAYVVRGLDHRFNEYFLVENRWRGTSYDAGRGIDVALDDEGVTIYHVDDAQWEAGAHHINDDETHKGVDVECADFPTSHEVDADDLDRGDGFGGNDGDENDLWDNSGYAFTDTSYPCRAIWYDGSPSGISIAAYSPPGAAMQVYLANRPAQPTLASIHPNFGDPTYSVTTEITGTDFLPGAEVMLNRTGSDDIRAEDVVVVSPAEITCEFSLPPWSATGAWNVVVTNPNGRSAIISSGFAIAPVRVTSVTPNHGARGSTATITEIGGTNFENGATVKLRRTGASDIVATNVVVTSPTTLACQFAIPATAETGAWNVIVTNPNGLSGSLMGGFTVTLPLPTVSYIIPTYGLLGSFVTVTDLAGANFQEGATVQLRRADSADIQAYDIDVVSPTRITCRFYIPVTAKDGHWDVRVQNPDGYDGTLPGGFEVVIPEMSVTAIEPATGAQGENVQGVSVIGGGFLPGSTVKLTRTGSAEINATNVVYASQEQIFCSINIPSTAAVGAWNVVVSGQGGYVRTLTDGFTVTAARPSVSSITPSSAVRGTTAQYTVAGNFFRSGATVRLWRAGSPDISATAVTVTSPTELSCTLALPPTAAHGLWNVTVTNVDGTSGNLSDGFRVRLPTPAPASIAPDSGTEGSTVRATIAGTGFEPGATVMLNETAGYTFPATNVSVLSATQLACDLALPQRADTTSFNVVVTNLDGSCGMLPNGFTVIARDLSITAVAPTSGARGATVPVTITGTGFTPGVDVTLKSHGSSPEIVATGVAVASPAQLSCQLPIPATADLGAWDVWVTYAAPGDDLVDVLSNGFTVTTASIAVSSIAPATGTRGSNVFISNLAGTGFVPGTTVKLTRPGSAEIVATGVTVPSSTTITCFLPLPWNAAVGAWTVVATKPDDQSAILADGFTITSAPVTVTGIAPNSGMQGATVAVTSLAGTGFAPGATVRLTRTGSADIIATNVVAVSTTTITCTFAIPATAATGAWNVVVATTGGQGAILANGFEVRAPSFSITSITPSTGARGTTVAVTNLAGHEFAAGATVKLTRPLSAEIAATNVVVVLPTQITCTFVIPPAAAAGAWNVVVTKSSGATATLVDGFTVTSPSFSITAITPNAGYQDGMVKITDLAGTGFVAGATVRLTRTGSPEIVATDVVVVSSSKITSTFTLPVTAPTGAWTVIVTNPDGQSAILAHGFTITYWPPWPTRISPATGAQGATVPVTVTGSHGHFQPGATVALTRTGYAEIPAHYIDVVSSTRINCTLVLPATGATGSWNVTVTNPDGQRSESLVNAFTITAPVTPTVTSTPTPMPTPGVVVVPGGADVPTDTGGDGVYDDVNGNDRPDFADVVLYFNQMAWIAANEPVTAFDYNGNGRIDFADVVWLFNHL